MPGKKKGEPVEVDTDEHPRARSTIEGLTRLKLRSAPMAR